MSSHDPQSLCQVLIRFRTDDIRDMPELGRAGWSALEQAEAELESTGVSVSLEPYSDKDDEGTRGFGLSDVLVNVVADAITMLLFRTVTDLMHQWQTWRQRPRHSTQSESTNQGPSIILQTGDKELTLDPTASDGEVYQQLALWTSTVLEAGSVTFRIANTQP